MSFDPIEQHYINSRKKKAKHRTYDEKELIGCRSGSNLQAAVRRNDIFLTMFILNEDAKMNQKDFRKISIFYKKGALVIAAKHKLVESTKILLNYGIKSSDALDEACKIGCIETVKLLLDHKIKSSMALYYASGIGHIEVVKLLLKDNQTSIYHIDVALKAAENNHQKEVVEELIKHKK